ncbi:MAG: hypothetical protein JRF53_18185, partial [Deltaproteobacteria bacterium]|nr:hypothetical protein [Deltaproteobacteria bacterium]
METEIKDILGQLKNMIEANRDMGLDPPPISNEVLDYLNAKAPERPVNPGRPERPVDSVRPDHPDSLE